MVFVNPFLNAAQFAHMLFCLLRIVPKIGGSGLFFFVGGSYFFGINVKDTSSTRPGVPLVLSVARGLA
jgi:hypothetical protein